MQSQSPSSMRRFHLRRGLLGAVVALPLGRTVRAQAVPAAQRDTVVKAAFLHKFASFVEWPTAAFPRPETPLRIGVLGDEQLWRDLVELAKDRDRDGRPVAVTRLSPGDTLGGFHILYLKASSPARIADLLGYVPEGTLTVADSDGAHPRGSVLSFFLEEGRVRFGASQDAATRQKLRLSSRLLAVARVVAGPEDDEEPALA